MSTTERVGAYGRRAGNVPPPPVAVVDTTPSYSVHEGWRVYAMTSTGVRFCPCTDNEAHARKVNRTWRLHCEQGNVDSVGNAMFVGGMILDPDGLAVEVWGDGVDLANPRWRGLERRTTWGRCDGCDDVMWPYRLVLDGRCRTCVEKSEAADPRPSWPGDSIVPPLRDWPDVYRDDHKPPHLGLPSGMRKPPKLKSKR
jgi:hypothetical protein